MSEAMLVIAILKVEDPSANRPKESQLGEKVRPMVEKLAWANNRHKKRNANAFLF
jgi:hypothetical protein